jgi:hypothetical protein
MNEFGNRISYNFIDSVVPVFVSFNHSVRLLISSLGKFDYYIYVDSGIYLPTEDTLTSLAWFIKHNEKNLGMVALFAKNDNWNSYDTKMLTKLYDPITLTIPIGGYLNLHFLAISEEMRAAYSRCLPDIFKGCGSEGTYPYLCAALKKKLLVCRFPVLNHRQNLDGGNLGFPEGYEFALFRRNASIYNIAKDGQEYGFGFEEWCDDKYRGDRAQFDKHGYAHGDNLFKFLHGRLFLSHEEFDYDREMKFRLVL